jgi:predicted lipoprotein
VKFLALILVLSAFPVRADMRPEIVDRIVSEHIIRGYEDLASATDTLDKAAQAGCTTSAVLTDTYHTAFDAWVLVSHLRFGPSETDDRAFALAFWPDSRGAIPRSLLQMLGDQDPAVGTAADFSRVSVAARGFYALELLLFDEGFAPDADPVYQCSLVRAITKDIAANADATLSDWKNTYTTLMTSSRDGGVYRTRVDVTKEFFKVLNSGLQFASETRLGRPLGTFEHPRPKRAEAWRSQRSLRHVLLSVSAVRELSVMLADNHKSIKTSLDAEFERSLALAGDLDDPVFAGVTTPQGRLRVEILQRSVEKTRGIATDVLEPALGVAAGFNALDGD